MSFGGPRPQCGGCGLQLPRARVAAADWRYRSHERGTGSEPDTRHKCPVRGAPAVATHMPLSDAFGPFDGVWLNCAHQGPMPEPARAAAMRAVDDKTSPDRI